MKKITHEHVVESRHTMGTKPEPITDLDESNPKETMVVMGRFLRWLAHDSEWRISYEEEGWDAQYTVRGSVRVGNDYVYVFAMSPSIVLGRYPEDFNNNIVATLSQVVYRTSQAIVEHVLQKEKSEIYDLLPLTRKVLDEE